MQDYTVAEFLKIAKYDEESNTYFIEAHWEDIFITVGEEDDIYNYGLIGDKSGSIFVKGEGEGSAFRYGAGEGDACRSGPGKGSAYRYGPGKGSAYRYGPGDGSVLIDGIEIKINEENAE